MNAMIIELTTETTSIISKTKKIQYLYMLDHLQMARTLNHRCSDTSQQCLCMIAHK